MLDLEKTAIECVNKLLSNEQIPINRLRKISLQWKEEVGGMFLPVLYCDFYEKTEKRE
jgi:hypothetical protein